MPVPFLAALMAPLAIVAPARQDEASVRAFIGFVYAGYGKDGPGARLGEPELYFEPELAAAIRKDADAAEAAGDMGKMDVDPFCSCQDFDAIKPAYGPVTVRGNRALVTVTFTNLGAHVTTGYDLVWTRAGWRIFDMDYGEGATLRAIYLPYGTSTVSTASGSVSG